MKSVRIEEISPQWTGLHAIFGGYVVARLLDAMACVDGFVVLSATVEFVGSVRPGEVTVDVDVVHLGSRTATVTGSLSQGHVRAVGVAKLGRRRGDLRTPPLDLSQFDPPEQLKAELPPWGAVAFDERVEVRHLPPPNGDPRTGARAWVRVRSDADEAVVLRPDSLAPMFLDVLPPGTWYVEDLEGFAPTIEMSVHLGPRPAAYDRWHLVEQRAVVMADDYWIEDSTMYDDVGRVVAVVRQTRIASDRVLGA